MMSEQRGWWCREGPRAPRWQSRGRERALSLGSHVHGDSAARGRFLEGEAPQLDLEGGRVGPDFLARDEILWDLPGWEWGMGRGAVSCRQPSASSNALLEAPTPSEQGFN